MEDEGEGAGDVGEVSVAGIAFPDPDVILLGVVGEIEEVVVAPPLVLDVVVDPVRGVVVASFGAVIFTVELGGVEVTEFSQTVAPILVTVKGSLGPRL